MQATVLSRLDNFAGRTWAVGETIPAEVMDKCTERTRSALLNARIISIDDGNNVGGTEMPAGLDARLALIEQGLSNIVERLDALATSDEKFTELRDDVDELKQQVDALAVTRKTKEK